MNYKSTNKLFYEKAVVQYGVSAKGVHWSNKETQYKRFEIIYKLLEEDFKIASIVDAGCGFGDFYNYLYQNDIHLKYYLGVDCYEKMIELSRVRFPHVDFQLLDILEDDLPRADYYIASGSLNILSRELFYRFIERCYDASSKGFVFNFLTKKSFNRISIEDVISYCSSFGVKIITKNDYLENDFTIFMKKK